MRHPTGCPCATCNVWKGKAVSRDPGPAPEPTVTAAFLAAADVEALTPITVGGGVKPRTPAAPEARAYGVVGTYATLEELRAFVAGFGYATGGSTEGLAYLSAPPAGYLVLDAGSSAGYEDLVVTADAADDPDDLPPAARDTDTGTKGDP